jgi:hemerythrin
MNPPTHAPYGAGHDILDRDQDVVLAILETLNGSAGNPGKNIDELIAELRASLDSHSENEEHLMEKHG